MTDWATKSDDQWLQVDEFVLGKDGKNANAPVRYGRVMWYAMVKEGQAPKGVKHGSKTLWRYGDVKQWVKANSPPPEATLISKELSTPSDNSKAIEVSELQVQAILDSLSPYDFMVSSVHHPKVESVCITKGKYGGLTVTINRLKGKPITTWVYSKPPAKD
jgi:hypothetical protein